MDEKKLKKFSFMDQDFYMEKTWAEELKEEFNKPYMKELSEFLVREPKEKNIYPPKDLIFNAFCQTAFVDVKVVIVGQDPYHGEGQAHGLSFSVPEGVSQPPSLKNIFKELFSDLEVPIPKSGCLLPWAKQGVFLLNATLTVREGEPKSHYGKGWEIFTDKVVEKLAFRKDPLVFLLWGQSAQEKCQNVLKDQKTHLVLKAAHPSFYSVSGFWGCRHFSKTNQFLEKLGKKAVDWSLS